MNRSVIGISALLGMILTALPAGLGTLPAWAYPPQPLFFPPLGLTVNQSARLNFNPPIPFPPEPLVVQLLFLDATGATLADSGPVDLAAGQGTSLEYPPQPAAAVTDPTGSSRAEVRAVVNVLSYPYVKGTATLELLDATGRTIFAEYPPEPVRAQTPPNSPPVVLGPLALDASRTARLNVANVGPVGQPPDPCIVMLSFFGTDGTLLSQQQTTVEPGQSVNLDLSGATFSGEFTAQLTFVGESRALTTSSLELFDSTSGATQAALAGSACTLMAPPRAGARPSR